MDRSLAESQFVKLREAAELTQKDVAEALGVSIQTIRNWEHGKAIPHLTIPQMKTLCRLVSKSIEDLPDTFGPPPPPPKSRRRKKKTAAVK